MKFKTILQSSTLVQLVVQLQVPFFVDTRFLYKKTIFLPETQFS